MKLLSMLLLSCILWKFSENLPAQSDQISTTKVSRSQSQLPKELESEKHTPEERDAKRKQRRKERRRQRKLEEEAADKKAENEANKIHLMYMSIPVGGMFGLCFFALLLWHMKNTDKLCFKRKKQTPVFRVQPKKTSANGTGFFLNDGFINSPGFHVPNVANSNKTLPTVNITNNVNVCGNDAAVTKSIDNSIDSNDNNNQISTPISRTISLDDIAKCSLKDNENNKLKQLKSVHKSVSLVNISINAKTCITVTKSCGNIQTSYNDEYSDEFTTSIVEGGSKSVFAITNSTSDKDVEKSNDDIDDESKLRDIYLDDETVENEEAIVKE